MKIVNIIHIGDEVKNWDDMSLEEKRMVANKINEQALKALGYVKRPTKDKTA